MPNSLIRPIKDDILAAGMFNSNSTKNLLAPSNADLPPVAGLFKIFTEITKKIPSVWIHHMLLPKDQIIKSDYYKYMAHNQSPLSQFALNILCMLYTIEIIIHFMRLVSDPTDQPEDLIFPGIRALSIACLILCCLLYTSGWTLFSVLYCKYPSSPVLDLLRKYQLTLQTIFQLSFTLVFAIDHIARSFAPECNEGFSVAFTIQFCNPYHSVHGFPLSTTIVLMLLPFLCVTILQEMRPWLVFITWVIVIFAMSFTAVNFQSGQTGSFVFNYALFSALILGDNLRQNYEKFLTTRKLAVAIDENELMASEERATEMRHMIANVAHDLKTVRLVFSIFPAYSYINVVFNILKQFTRSR